MAKDSTTEGYRKNVASDRTMKRGAILQSKGGATVPPRPKRKRSGPLDNNKKQKSQEYPTRALQGRNDYQKGMDRFNIRKYIFPQPHWMFLQRYFDTLLGNLAVWLHLNEERPSTAMATGATRKTTPPGFMALKTLENTAPVILAPFQQKILSPKGATLLKQAPSNLQQVFDHSILNYDVLTADTYKSHRLVRGQITS